MPATNLVPSVVEGVPEAIYENRQRIKYNYGKRSRRLPVLDIGSPVYVQLRPESSKLWTPGTVSNTLGDRSYLVEVDGSNYRRDAVNVKPRKESATPLTTPSDWMNMLSTSAALVAAPECTPSVTAIYSHERSQVTSNDTSPTELLGPQVAQPSLSATPATASVRSETLQNDRPKRQTKIPSKFKDFVVTIK